MILVGCVNYYPKTPKHLIQEEKMVEILAEVLMAEEHNNLKGKLFPAFDAEFLKDSIYPLVFERFEIKDSVFYESYNFYETNPHLFHRLMDSTIVYLGKLKLDPTTTIQNTISEEDIVEKINSGMNQNKHSNKYKRKE